MNKIENLKLMNRVIRKSNNQNIVFYWLSNAIPDGATKYDYEELVNEYTELEKMFTIALSASLKDGLYKATPEELEFAKKYQPYIKNY